MAKVKLTSKNEDMLQIRKQPLYYKIYGKEQIETEAIEQMDTAMRLPVSQAGALMPDAHVGLRVANWGSTCHKKQYCNSLCCRG